MSKLLINEPPLQVLPTLAKEIGLNEALVLQQLHYHSLRSKDDGWVQRALSKWAADEFKFWSYDTFQRAVRRLRELELIETETVGVGGGQGGTRREARIRVNHGKLDALELQVSRSPQSAATSGPQSAVTSDRILHGPRTDLREERKAETPPTPPRGVSRRRSSRRKVSTAIVEPCPNGTTDPAAIAAWQVGRDRLSAAMDPVDFEVWVDPVHAHAITDGDLVLACSLDTHSWVKERLVQAFANAAGQPVRLVACSGAKA